jgi:hypothetical protein
MGGGLMRVGAFVLVVLVTSCSWTPRQRETFARELARTSAVRVIEDVICERIEERVDVQGGQFQVPKGSCQRSQLPSGNLEFSFVGEGSFSKGYGFVTGQFEQAGSVEYQVVLKGGYIYVLPENIRLDVAKLRNLSFFAQVGEGLFNSVSNGVREALDAGLNTPRTIILDVDGRQCVVKGWVPPRSIPTRCGSGSNAFFPRRGTMEPQPTAPASWASEGLRVTKALAPVADDLPLTEEQGLAVSERVKTKTQDLASEQAASLLSTPQQVPRPKARMRAPVSDSVVEHAFVSAESAQVTTAERAPMPSGAQAPMFEDSVVLNFLNEQGASLAQRICETTHDGCRNTGMFDFTIERLVESTAVELQAAWSGRTGNAMFVTTCRWEFDGANHVRLTLLSDNSGKAVTEEELVSLDAYFREEVFPALVRSMTDQKRAVAE